MIPRYSLPEMSSVWSDEAKLRAWLQVEVTVAEAWAEAGVVPREAIERIRGAKIDQARFEALEAETAYLAALGAAARLVVSETELVLSGEDGQEVLRFVPAVSESPAPVSFDREDEP